MYEIRTGCCLEVLRTMPDASVDSIVTDPPYGLSFMGKKWDYDVPSEEIWRECLRVLKPGGHLLAFAGTRTQHRMAVRIEDAGFEIRDMIAWVYSTGFPKSLDVSKAIDKAAGAERTEVIGKSARHGGGIVGNGSSYEISPEVPMLYAPATDAARQWQGWGTALKPALETVTFASKPYTDGQERDIILSNLIRLEARIWLLLSASTAEKSSTSSQSDYGAACAIAQWSADEITSTQAALCDQMDTSLFELATTTSLSIVSSWRRILAESWSDGSTSTTETKSSTTTDWKTLRFSLSQITPASIIRACSLPGGFSANATTAESHFNASLSLLQSIRTLSATERAMSLEAESCRDAGVKPSLDPCIMARKPLIGTVAENVLRHGTGGLNIDGCRVATSDALGGGHSTGGQQMTGGWERPWMRDPDAVAANAERSREAVAKAEALGRWPANLIHDGSDGVVALFPDSNGAGGSVPNVKVTGYGDGAVGSGRSEYFGGERAPFNSGSGSAARFFYCAKASKKDRNQGCEGVATWESVALDQEIHSVLSLAKAMSEGITHLLDDSECSMTLCGSITTGQYLTDTTFIISTVSRLITALKTSNFSQSSTTRESILDAIRTLTADGSNLAENAEHINQLTLSITSEKTVSALGAVSALLKTLSQIKEKGKLGNAHSTVKPTELMRYLCRLVTPPHGTVLDPFMGSGSTGKAAMLEGFQFIGIEREADYVEIAKARIEHALFGDLLD